MSLETIVCVCVYVSCVCVHVCGWVHVHTLKLIPKCCCQLYLDRRPNPTLLWYRGANLCSWVWSRV